jgi:hypothetical protein
MSFSIYRLSVMSDLETFVSLSVIALLLMGCAFLFNRSL